MQLAFFILYFLFRKLYNYFFTFFEIHALIIDAKVWVLPLPNPVSNRILLKLSGEVLDEKSPVASSPTMADFIANEVVRAVDDEFQISIVIGGGNIMRGAIANQDTGFDRVTADQMGMLATLINALTLREAIKSKDIECIVMSAFKVGGIAKRFNRDKAVKSLEKKKVVIFAGGTGNPFFSTDTAAALRALEIGASTVVKGSKVDGVYDKDPMKFPGAKKYDRLTYDEAIQKDLKVMDLTAFALLKDSGISMVVYKMSSPGALLRILRGAPEGTILA